MKTKTETKKEKEKPNKLEKLVLNITEPMKMDQELTFQMLSVFVGANDSGKSFLLKIAFALGTIGITPNAPPGPNSSAQFVLDNTFTDQNLNGLIKSVYTKGSVSVELEKGKVQKVDVQGKTVPIRFMSTDMRTFDQMALYLRVRKDAGDDPIAFMQKRLKAYRLYDVTYMETLLTKMPLLLDEGLRDMLKAYDFRVSIVSIEADLDKCEFNAVIDDGTKKNISTYGKGHQAILNMALGATL